MKKNTVLIVLILISMFVLGALLVLVTRPFAENGTADNSTSAYTTQSAAGTTVPSTTETEPYVLDISPNTIGLYIPANDGTKDRVMVSEFIGEWTSKKDIDCFEAFASSDSRISGTNFADMWKSAWNAHENGQNGKIGYVLSFTLSDGSTVERMIQKPSDADSFKEYIEVYLYDDINQKPGVRYTHISDSEITANTVLSSIKLTGGSKIDEVTGITLTAFIYTGEDCFNSEGAYIGNVSASVIIKEG